MSYLTEQNMSVVETKKAFAKTYLQLIGLSDTLPNDQFYSTSDYSKLDSLGPSLPTMKLAFPQKTVSKDVETIAQLNFKSIRPPFKFSCELTNIPAQETIYKLKSTLIDHVDSLKTGNVKPDNLKLMVKSKVAQDSATIKSLIGDNHELSFNVMVSAPKETKEQTPSTPVVDEDPEVVQPITITQTTWDKIEQVLITDLPEVQAKEVLAKFKAIA